MTYFLDFHNRIGDQPSPYRKSPGEAKKRKLEEESFSGEPSSSSRSTAVTTSHAEGSVTIDESSSDGSFVKLLNTSDDKVISHLIFKFQKLSIIC